MKIPIVFSCDQHVAMPAGVCISSLLANAREETHYDIYILHNAENLRAEHRREIEKVKTQYPDCQLTFIDVGNHFTGCFEVRNITIAAYYRLMIAELLPQYDKVLYGDVDMIFRDDLSHVYETSLRDNELIAGVNTRSNRDIRQNCEKIGHTADVYVNTGFLVINTKLWREEQLTPKLLAHTDKPYKYVDQDIINLVCQGRTEAIPLRYNYTNSLYADAHQHPDRAAQLSELELRSTVHYTGGKPWKSPCLRGDIWWEYYRRSAFFDAGFYYRQTMSYIGLGRYSFLSLAKHLTLRMIGNPLI